MTKKEFTKVLFTKPVEPWYKNNSTSNNKFSVTIYLRKEFPGMTSETFLSLVESPKNQSKKPIEPWYKRNIIVV